LTREEIKDFYLEALKLEPKLLIDYVIKEIRVYEDKLEITFNSPIKRSPDKNQDFFLFTFYSKLPQYIQANGQTNMTSIEVLFYI